MRNNQNIQITRSTVVVLGLVLGAASGAYAQRTLYVNGDSGNDAWTGLCETWDGGACGPKATIQAGIDTAFEGDAVVVANGVYVGAGNKDLDYRGKAITVRSEHGPAACIIDCEGSGRGFFFHTAETNLAILDGFTVTNGNGIGGGAIYCAWGSSPTIRNCIIIRSTSNAAGISGGGVLVQQSNPRFFNCIITANTAAVSGGGVGVWLNGNPVFVNCTILGNSAATSGGGGAMDGGQAQFTNCIVWGNAVLNPDDPLGPQFAISQSAVLTVGFCDVQGGQAAVHVTPPATLNWGAGNMDADPTLAFTNDGHLMPGSPCIDAGSNDSTQETSDLDGNPRVLDGDGNGTATVDLGACEYNPQIPVIAVWPHQASFYGWLDVNPDDQFVSIRNAGGGTLNWQVAPSCGWLAATPLNGTSVGEVDQIALHVNVSGLALGDYVCRLIVSAAQAPNSPSIVVVKLHVGAVKNVPADYGTIQAAIDAASPDDLVLVANGTYTGTGNRDLRFLGKAVAVRSAGGADNCTIDCQSAGRAFEISFGEGERTVIRGFTIINGSSAGLPEDSGGAIRCVNTQPTIEQCVIRNSRSASRGGGIYLERSSPTIRDCLIYSNESPSEGGGIACRDGCNPTLTGVVIRRNTANYGGGIWCVSGSPHLTACVIRENTAFTHGGGVYNDYGLGTFTDCVFVGNLADDDGGAIYSNAGGDLTLVHTAILANQAYRGGGLCLKDTRTAVVNSIVWGNLAVYGPQLAVLFGNSGSPCGPAVSYCDVQGGEADVLIDPNCSLTWGPGNLDADPNFAFADDYHLLPGSPCIDAGTNNPPGGLPAADFEGGARPVDGDGNGTSIADLGVYERNPTRPAIAFSPADVEVYLPQGVSDLDDIPVSVRNAGGGMLSWQFTPACTWLPAVPATGESTGEIDQLVLRPQTNGLPIGTYECAVQVTDPQASNSPRVLKVTAHIFATLRVPADYPTIQAAIDAATDNAVVVVSDGVYAGAGNKDLDLRGKRITVRSQNGPANCTIDCQNSGRGFYLHGNETEQSVVRGFAVANGNVDSDGGGICIDHSHATIVNCTIHACTAAYSGGGIACYGRATIQDCVITACFARDGGGACVGSNNEPTFQRCTFRLNSAWRGGAFKCTGSGSNPRLMNCTIAENFTTYSNGGAIHCELSAAPTVKGCTVRQNTAAAYGGAFYIDQANPLISECLLEDNRAVDGGALYAYRMGFSGPAVLTNCIVSGNTATQDGGGFMLGSTSLARIANSQIDHNHAGRDGGGIYMYSGGGMLANCTVVYNTAANYGGGFYCHSWGSASNDIFWYNTAAQGPQIAFVTSSECTLTVTYSNVQGGQAAVFVQGPGTLVWGDGNIDEDPHFEGKAVLYRLAPNSPCINAGTNANVPPDTADLNGNQNTTEPTPYDVDGLSRIRSEIVDMGAFESQVVLRPGDLNCDGRVDFADIDPFVLALSDPVSYQTAYPNCNLLNGDCNSDGNVDFADIDPFVALLSGG